MGYIKFLTLEKIILFALMALTMVGFCFFESSLILKIFVFILAIVGLATAFYKPSAKPQLMGRQEFLFLLTLYLGLYSLYNLLYGLSLPLYWVMMAVLALVCLLFFGIITLDRINELVSRGLFQILTVLVGLIILEIFLSLSYWPIDPQIKSLIIVSIFYFIINLIYLFAHNMLKLKRIIGFLVAIIIVLGLSFLSLFLGFAR